MSITHMIILGIIALIVIPPDKLPEVARQVARFINELKNGADQILGELKQEAIFKPDDFLDKNTKDNLSKIKEDLTRSVMENKTNSPPPVAPVQANDINKTVNTSETKKPND